MNPDVFRAQRGRASDKTGLKVVTQFPPSYYGFSIIVLDQHQRLPFNFAVNFSDGYREFKTLKSAQSGIRAHLRGAA